ncbi:hypothetical protein [Cupriavidus pinatubonensis]|uniref:hypothetical protein n=1 Tax=Cupriavidus pinatubonensis TaxID=248026 RepID=UPI001129072D|nr:hypothetical protein [Cupriavidus pinatubonensis]TPQ43094.1 hypothetical protein C2U69_03990 [Cupriavidus pinatubonensis]
MTQHTSTARATQMKSALPRRPSALALWVQSNAGVSALADLRPIEVPTTSKNLQFVPVRDFTRNLRHLAQLRMVAADVHDLVRDNQVALGINAPLNAVSSHPSSLGL